MSSHDFLQINLKFLRFWGCYPLDESAGKLKQFLFTIQIGLGLLSFLWLMIGNICDTIHKSKLPFAAYSLNIVYMGAYFLGVFSILFSLFKRNQTKELLHDIQHLLKFQTNNHLKNEDMQQFQKISARLIQFFCYGVPFSTFTVTIVPLFGAWSQLQLPICEWSPVDLTNPFVFALAYMLQMYGQTAVGGLCAAIDGFFVSTVAIVAYEFTLVGCEFENCLYNALVDYGIPSKRVAQFQSKFENLQSKFETSKEIEPDTLIHDVILTERFSYTLNSRLIPVIQYHLRLVQFAVKVEDHFWSLIFMKISASLYYHVFMGFVMVTTDDPALLTAIIQYESSALLELLIFSTAGQFLMTQSENISDCVYKSPWYICPKYHQVNLKVVMMRSARVCKLSIGKLSDLTLPTFLMILNTAASYLAVLREITR